jgi:hypothetical protein
MSEILFIAILFICIAVGLRSFVSGIKGENKVLWLSLNSANQKHYAKFAPIYNIILGVILVLGCGYVLIEKLI